MGKVNNHLHELSQFENENKIIKIFQLFVALD